MEAHMRFTRTACLSALTLALALSAAPALAAPADPSRTLEQPCPPGQWLVWVDRPAGLPKLYIDPRTGQIEWYPGEPEFHGWACQPIKLSPIEPHR